MGQMDFHVYLLFPFEELTVNAVAKNCPQEWCGTSSVTVTVPLQGSRLCQRRRGSFQKSVVASFFSFCPCVCVCMCVLVRACVCVRESISSLTSTHLATSTLQAHLPIVHLQLHFKSPGRPSSMLQFVFCHLCSQLQCLLSFLWQKRNVLCLVNVM